MSARLGFALIAAALLSVQTPRAASPLRVMLLDGESGGPYHRWPIATAILRRELEETGRFDVTVVTAPPAAGDFSGFRPDFGAYKAVVLNYDAPDERWSDDLKTAFERYVDGGGGVVVVHAADNAFPAWGAYNAMIGVGGWRGRTERSGPFWYYKDRALVADRSPGPAGSHGIRVPFRIDVREPEHPIVKGLPPRWMHQGDELYAHLRGPGERMTVLATAFSDPANHGSGRDEPQLMVIGYGKGRVFHTTLGHDASGLSSVDFVVTLQRGTEWAATGAVTQPVPAAFPTANVVSYRSDLAALDPAYKNGLNPLDQARTDSTRR
jgi:uncharacterized protein